MTRLVRGADGRMWTVRTHIEWSNPAGVDEFEHDVNAGRTSGIVMAVIVMGLVAVLVAWTPSDVVIPFWLLLALAMLILFFPARWALRRQWTVVAETPGDLEEHGPERWVGAVRGMMAAHQETTKIARDIEVYSTPAVDGPLQPID
ncbi:DUF983 domain-containing protein [Allokutzneria sp. NRRL B-24872]|uniref:DUF983 domain-containing protein n=1 Tax=Allokutzneria sp. NRRL B-24872 TaxID=1137961 RepID=UPI000A366E81|nr:DUF983 domain-containing protein [Allokutzneria sp. NRRL B-24872]